MAVDTAPPPVREETPPRIDRVTAAAAGISAAAIALATGELLAGLLPGAPSLVVAVGGAVIDAVPAPVKDFAISVFGTADKIALVVGILVLCAVAGAVLGVAAARRFAAGAAGFAAFAAVGAVAALTDPRASVPLAVISALCSAGVGVWVLRVLLTRARRTVPVRATGRRDFLRLSLLLVAIAGGAAAFGRGLAQRAGVVAAREDLALPPVDQPLPPIPDAVTLDVPGITPYVTDNADFYRIDTALTVPQVDPVTWRMGVTGMVEQEVTLGLDDLFAMEQVEADITLACVSNEVGGELIGNARWQGVRLADVLALAGVQPGATQLVGRAVDGFTVGFPTAIALENPDALVAVAMNGEPLPVEHGFPARLVVPGLYGYVSATKWLAELELTTWEAFDAYWVPRGWAKEGPIKTQSRIDVPSGQVAAGQVAIAGVAWAQGRGIAEVEVRVDDGAWQEATLAAELNDNTWRQWVLPWDAQPGPHVLQVRATDETGETQTQERTPVAPDGASGWHTVRVNVA